MNEYISREAIIREIKEEIKACDVKFVEDIQIKKGLKIALKDIKVAKAADVQPVNQWISVKERLPEIGKSVLIYYPYWGGDEIQVAKLDCDGITFDVCGEFNVGIKSVTHWMPLPEPPKDGDEK